MEKTIDQTRLVRRKTVAVLFGGCSPEYSVSLQSAHAVLQHIDPERYEVLPVGITAAGDWFYYTGPLGKIPADTWHSDEGCIPAAISPSRSARALLLLRPDGVEARRLDAALPILHGQNGEDGTVQGLLQLAGIPVAGCGVLASALCMDKDRAHRLAQAAGVAVPASFVLAKGEDVAGAAARAETLGYPLFVKPVRAGSSYGVTKVNGREELPAALELAFRYDDEVILEQGIPGFEVGCAVMGRETLTIGAVDEIELSDGFFDFTEKYTLKTSAIHVPARVDGATADRIRQAAAAVYRALGCSGFARVDLFLTPSGEIVFNEVNTIPGFTAHSRFPNMLKAAGFSFEAIVAAILEEATQA